MRLSAFVVAILCMCAGCASMSDYGDTPRCVIILSYEEIGSPRLAAIASKPEDIAKCEALFPKYKSIPGSDVGVASETVYDFMFCFGARCLRVGSDGEYWGMGEGALSVNGDIGKVIADLNRK